MGANELDTHDFFLSSKHMGMISPFMVSGSFIVLYVSKAYQIIYPAEKRLNCSLKKKKKMKNGMCGSAAVGVCVRQREGKPLVLVLLICYDYFVCIEGEFLQTHWFPVKPVPKNAFPIMHIFQGCSFTAAG